MTTTTTDSGGPWTRTDAASRTRPPVPPWIIVCLVVTLLTIAGALILISRAFEVAYSIAYSNTLTPSSPVRTYTILTEEGTLSVELVSPDRDMALALKDADGAIIGSADEEQGRHTLTADVSAGPYTAELRLAEPKAGAGSYEFSISFPADEGKSAAELAQGKLADPISPEEASACLSRSNIVVLNGSQRRFPDAMPILPGSTVDARQAAWDNKLASDYPVYLENAPSDQSNLCWLGGRISSHYPPSTEWEKWHETAGLKVRAPRAAIRGIRIHNAGDGISFSQTTADEWRIEDAHLSEIHDDCIENDYMTDGTIEGSLLDGCYVGFSARGHSGQETKPEGLENVMSVRQSLIRLEAMPTVYKGDAPGHGGFFKWAGDPVEEGYGPKLSLHDNIFRVDQEPNHGSLGLPTYEDPATDIETPYLCDCSNNVIVWLGPGAYPADMPSCFKMTTDEKVWDDAVAAWLAAHREQN